MEEKLTSEPEQLQFGVNSAQNEKHYQNLFRPNQSTAETRSWGSVLSRLHVCLLYGSTEEWTRRKVLVGPAGEEAGEENRQERRH